MLLELLNEVGKNQPQELSWFSMFGQDGTELEMQVIILKMKKCKALYQLVFCTRKEGSRALYECA